jgi:pimeloyl-ACP methyl ester carboxylesterase
MDQQDGVQRQFMFSAFFPVERRAGTVAARFVDIFEPMVEQALAYLTEGLDAETRKDLLPKLRSIRLQSVRGGAPERSGAPYPVLVYYPGGESNRFANVDVCEALASHGYVVLSVDGPHDATLVVFPDGHLCKGPLEGDYVSPGVGDVGYLLDHLDELNGEGVLCGMMDADSVGVFGHSRGGYIANIIAFRHERVKAAASIDCYLWGYAAGLEGHPPDFQAKVRSTAKPLLRLCGRPAGSDPQMEAEFCLNRDGGDFIGSFSLVAFPGWSHGDFGTTPWLCGRGPDLLANQSQRRDRAAETLIAILGTFFDIHLLGANPDQLDRCVRQLPELALVTRAATK